MLFNSYQFVFVFMPVTLLVFATLSPKHHTAALVWLTVASLVFYVSWEPRTSWVLFVSIAFNFFIGWKISESGRAAARWFLIAGVTANLLLLGFFKYAAFAVDIVNLAVDSRYTRPTIDLPLGISFFTFTQIAYLVDAYRREVSDHNPLRYSLFVTYFPHLVAGPIIHHKPVMAQFADPKVSRLHTLNWVVGLILFSIGLAKKLILADPLGELATPVFDAVRLAGDHSIVSCWVGIIAYTFQLYFDFSGYSDMAVGLSLLFGVTIPINFLSPYKATSIIDFWRTWHISLSNFLRDYLYISLGGNRRGPARRYVNLFLTMVLGGLWHGAGWNFIVWGALHGIYLLINHAWHNVVAIPINRWVGNALTFFAVLIAWVFFRAADLTTALRFLKSMFSLSQLQHLGEWRWTADPILSASGQIYVTGLLAVAAAIALVAPNSAQITAFVASRLDSPDPDRQGGALTLAAAYGILLGIGIVFLGRPSAFLYFQF
jgi:alginate O-acetyltransferase complex protein AlgI